MHQKFIKTGEWVSGKVFNPKTHEYEVKVGFVENCDGVYCDFRINDDRLATVHVQSVNVINYKMDDQIRAGLIDFVLDKANEDDMKDTCRTWFMELSKKEEV